MDNLCSLYIGMFVCACIDGQMRCQCWLPLVVLYFTQVSQIDHEGVQATALKVVCDLLLLYGLQAFKSSTEDDSRKVSMVQLQCGLTSNPCQKYCMRFNFCGVYISRICNVRVFCVFKFAVAGYSGVENICG